MVIGGALHFPLSSAAIAGAVLCFVVRYLALWRAWRLPVARSFDFPEHETDLNR
jgi:uncharacterized membrane protein YeiH